jgi:hypothetical protein
VGRGPHPRDAELFAERWHETLRTAVSELSWLETRGYPARASLKLVGDRHRLRARQRDAVARCACSDDARESRRSRQVQDLTDRDVVVDGLNVLITVEVALEGGLVLQGRDGAHRDIASIHGSYRRVAHTARALELLGEALKPARAVRWLLDRPVSNSGRLAGAVRTLGETLGGETPGREWAVELLNDPDRALRDEERVVASSDAGVLDGGGPWVDLPGLVLEELQELEGVWVLGLG